MYSGYLRGARAARLNRGATGRRMNHDDGLVFVLRSWGSVTADDRPRRGRLQNPTGASPRPAHTVSAFSASVPAHWPLISVLRLPAFLSSVAPHAGAKEDGFPPSPVQASARRAGLWPPAFAQALRRGKLASGCWLPASGFSPRRRRRCSRRDRDARSRCARRRGLARRRRCVRRARRDPWRCRVLGPRTTPTIAQSPPACAAD